MFSLEDKIVVIFGGNGILGKYFCKSLLEAGAIVYCCDIKVDEDAFVQQLRGEHPKRFALLKADSANKADLSKIYNDILEKHERVDILINATTSKGKDFYLPFEDVSLEGWEIGLKGNLTAAFLACQTFIPIMRERKQGSIINISSIYGILGNDQSIYEGSNLHEVYVKDSPDIKQVYSHGVYNAAKGGLTNFTRYLAAYYGKYNVRVNTLTPGGVYYAGENDEFLRKYSAKVPLGRKANPEELCGALVFLASDASTYVTGHNLIVDGGFSIW